MAARDIPQDPVHPGAMLATTHALADGSRVRLRLTRPTDLPRIEAFLGGLSAETHPTRFAFYDLRERLALAATLPTAGGEEIAGLADVAIDRNGSAEIDVIVAEDARRSGLATLLCEAVASVAIHRGATRLGEAA